MKAGQGRLVNPRIWEIELRRKWLFDEKNEESKGRTLLAAVRENDYGEADEYAAAAANTGRKAAGRGNAVVSTVHHRGEGSTVRLDGEKMGEGRLGAMGQCWPQRKQQAEHSAGPEI